MNSQVTEYNSLWLQIFLKVYEHYITLIVHSLTVTDN